MPKTQEVAFSRKAEFTEAVQAAQQAASAYYDSDTQVMTDAEYDALVERIEATVAAHPGWDAGGLLDQVAAGASAGGDVAHPVPMLSLAKSKEMDDIRDFLSRIEQFQPVTEVKLDGLAVRAEYRDGVLVLVATRGDGLTGEDVTVQAATIAGLPARLSTNVDCEVRGEVYMTDADFVVANTNRVAAGKAAFVNPRNATAGTLRNAGLEYHAPMSFAAYDASGGPVDAFDTHTERMAFLGTLGVQTAVSLLPDVDPTGNPVEVIEEIGQRRASLGFPIDGAVIKTNSLAAREDLGSVSRTPRWATAWKYPADTAVTVLRDIEVAIGRTGQVGLRAVLDPVFVGGTTITYATVHNPKWVMDAGLLVGGRVTVYRAGDVIPRVTAPADGQQPREAKPWVPPTECPQCGEEFDTSSLLWRCVTPDCSTVGRVVYFCSRDCMDIEGVGEEIANALVESGLVNDVADLYALTVDQVAAVRVGETPSGADRLIGQAVAKKIVAQIEASKQQPLARGICSLGIPKTGRTISRRLAAHFGSLAELRAASVDDLTAVEGIAAEKAEAIHAGLASMSAVIDRLVAAGITTEAERPATSGEALPLAGLTVVVTGAMSGPLAGLSRNEMNELIERAGGKSSGSVSTKTSMLVCGEAGSSKYTKAQSLGVPIVSPEVFAEKVAAVF